MTPAWLLTSLFTWSLHIAALIGIGILAARAAGWSHPQSRLRFFQLLLAVSLLLPLIEPWRPPPSPAFTGGSVTIRSSQTVAAPVTAAPIAWETFVLFLLAAGVLARLALLGFGLVKLRSLRRRGRAIHVEGLVGVEVREVASIKGPAAFGWLHPVILLPAGMPSGPVREASLRHELQHVLRRDWLESVIERAAASLLWFHPMAWWLLERIHLTREQAVDLEVAGAGPERDQYLQSLLTSAGLANLPALPAASFVRRPRHLVERVAFLSQETKMSIRNTAASAALAILVSGAALAVANFYLPLQLSAQETGPSPLEWTRGTNGQEGTVQLEATVNAAGEVIDARVVSGPDDLRKQALQSALYWRYTKDAAERRVLPVTIKFIRLNPPTGDVLGGIRGGIPGGVSGGIIGGIVGTPPPPSIEQATFQGVDYVGLSTGSLQRVAAIMASLHSGQKLTTAQVDQLRRDVTAIDASLRVGVSMTGGNSGTTLRLQVNKPAEPPEQVRVGGNVQEANLIHKVDPVYPPLAREARIQGTVRFNVMVGKEGSVEQMTLVAGHPLLVQAAQEALRQFKYRPTLLNGQPIAVQTTVDINFVL